MKYNRLTKRIANDEEAFLFHSSLHEGIERLAELEDKIESGELCDRKETAREILKPLYDAIMEYPDCCVNLSEDIKFLMEKYGIDLENEK